MCLWVSEKNKLCKDAHLDISEDLDQNSQKEENYTLQSKERKKYTQRTKREDRNFKTKQIGSFKQSCRSKVMLFYFLAL